MHAIHCVQYASLVFSPIGCDALMYISRCPWASALMKENVFVNHYTCESLSEETKTKQKKKNFLLKPSRN